MTADAGSTESPPPAPLVSDPAGRPATRTSPSTIGPRDGTTTAPRGEQTMVPRASFESDDGRPILKEPTWQALDIAGYLFLGGLAGASSVLAAGLR